MLRILLLVIYGVLLVQSIITIIKDNKVEIRGLRLMVTFIYGLTLYYILAT